VIPTNVFDHRTFVRDLAKDIEEAVRPELKEMSAEMQDFESAMKSLIRQTEWVLAELKTVTDPAIAAMLQQDLTAFLPAQRLAIQSILASRLSKQVQDALEAVWRIFVKAILIAAKALAPVAVSAIRGGI
jgi:hypothetical protein